MTGSGEAGARKVPVIMVLEMVGSERLYTTEGL